MAVNNNVLINYGWINGKGTFNLPLSYSTWFCIYATCLGGSTSVSKSEICTSKNGLTSVNITKYDNCSFYILTIGY